MGGSSFREAEENPAIPFFPGKMKKSAKLPWRNFDRWLEFRASWARGMDACVAIGHPDRFPRQADTMDLWR